MSYNDILDENAYSVGIGVETDLNTAAVSFTWIDFESLQVSYEAAQVDTKRARRSRGSATKRLTGKVWPKLTLRFPENGQLSDYDYTSDTPDLKGAMALLEMLGGSSGIAYQAGGMSPTDGNTVSLITSTGKIGCLVAGRESSGLVSAMGFIESLSGAGPFAANLFEDLAVEPGSAIARIPTVTKYPSTTQPGTWTIRVCGEDSGREYQYLGCAVSRARRFYDAEWRPHWEVELISYGGEVRGTSGGLQAVTECLMIEPLLERGGSRFVLGSDIFTGFDDATVDADGSCDVRNVELNIAFAHHPSLCPSGRQGVKYVRFRQPDIGVSFSVPDITDFEVSSEPFAESAWRNGTEFALSCYQGDTPGRITAWNTPRLIPSAYPQPVWIDGGRYLNIACEAYHYTGDGASTDAGNKVLRFSQG